MNKDFDRQFSITNFPFKTVLDADSIDALKIEFINAPLKADIHKYALQYWQESDFKPGRFEEMRTKDGRTLSEVDDEYYKLLSKNKLPKKYYTRDLTKTNMVEKLTAIGGVFSALQDYVLQPIAIDPVSLKTEAENAAKSILNIVSQIDHLPLRQSIVNFILGNNENMRLTIENAINEKCNDAGRTESYKRLKLYFNNYILGLSDKPEVVLPLENIVTENISDIKNAIRELKETTEKNNLPKPKVERPKKEKRNLSFHDICLNEDSYDKAISIFVKWKLIDPQTLKYIGGKPNKKGFASVIKNLLLKGYYKPEILKLTDEDVLNILKTSFGSFGITAIKNTPPANYIFRSVNTNEIPKYTTPLDS